MTLIYFLRYILAFSSILLICLTSKGQIKTSITLSEKHQQRISQTQDIRKKLKKYHKFHKMDSLHTIRHFKDSLVEIPDPSGYLKYANATDSLGQFDYEDSLANALNTLVAFGGHTEIRQFFNAYYKLDSLHRPKLDTSLLTDKVQVISEQSLRKYTSDMDQIQGIQSLNLPDYAKPTATKVEINPQEKLNSFQDEVITQNPADGMHIKLLAMKGKYRTVPDITLTEKELQEMQPKVSMLDKMQFGGNFEILSTSPLISSLEIQLGFRVNDKLILGAGFDLRKALIKRDSIKSNILAEGYGYSIYLKRYVSSGFFGYGESSAMHENSFFKESPKNGDWQYECLIGLGKEVKIVKSFKLSTFLLYDVNHRNNQLHSLPLVFKLGYSFN